MKTQLQPTQSVAITARGQLLDLALFESVAEAECYTRAVRQWAREGHVILQVWRQNVQASATQTKAA